MVCSATLSFLHRYTVNELKMWDEGTLRLPIRRIFGSALYMSEDENSSNTISEVDTDGKEATTYNDHQDTKNLNIKKCVSIPDDILLLSRQDVPRMVSVVYGCNIDDVPGVMNEDVSNQRKRQQEMGRKGSRSKSSNRTGNLREAAGQRPSPPGVEPHGAGPSHEKGGHLNAVVEAGANDIKDEKMKCRKRMRSSSPTDSQRRILLRCEACGHQLPPFIQALAQQRATISLAAGEEEASTDGAFPEHPQIQDTAEIGWIIL